MYKIFSTALFLSLFSVLTSAQALDEAFLESLPEGVASDLIMRSESKKAEESTQYRRPSTFIEKPEPTSQRFGAQIFSMMQSSLMPLNEPNFDSSYTLDYGDELELQLIGQKASIESLQIKRDGSVNIKDIGKLFISGLSLRQAIDLITNKINQSFIGVDSYITLTNVRDIQIILAGNVYNPGSYTLNGNSNIFHALSVSGGPSALGSFRSIYLIRDNATIETIDLYQTFIYGKSNFKTRLRSGDIVFINPVKSVVSISGAVKRPGVYELLKDENLSQIIFFSNGLNPFADQDNMKLERILDGSIKGIPIQNITQFNDIKSNDGDRIFIREHSFRSVNVRGAILNPGTYLMNEGDTITDAILKAGGYSEFAYPFGTIYENLNAKKINEDALQALYEESLDNILSLNSQVGSEVDFTSIMGIIAELKNAEASGRVIVDLSNDNATDNLIQDGDTISIPEFSDQVFIFGEVSSSGSAKFKRSEKFSYYIRKKGGYTKNADKKAIYVIQPNGVTNKITLNKNIFINQAEDIKIFPGSIIYVPREIEKGYASRLAAQSYAAILGSLGVSLASLSVLKD